MQITTHYGAIVELRESPTDEVYWTEMNEPRLNMNIHTAHDLTA